MLILLSQISILGLTAFQDFKERAISIFIIPALIGVGVLHAIENGLLLADIFASTAFVSVQLLLVYLYFSIKKRSFKIDFTNSYLGLGDILFFYAIVPFFGFYDFVIMLTGGLVFSLLAHYIYSLFYKTKTIPLAGWLSIFLIQIFFLKY